LAASAPDSFTPRTNSELSQRRIGSITTADAVPRSRRDRVTLLAEETETDMRVDGQAHEACRGAIMDCMTNLTGGTFSVVDAVERALDAIEAQQPRLHAFTRVFADEARARARELQHGSGSGPLHGVPVAVKDLFDVAGATTTGACAALCDQPAAVVDSTVVKALRGAGAVIVGKTNQHELGAGATGLLSAFGAAVNPWDTRCLPGGSSSGSAVAVTAEMVPVAIGSDTGGSIRIPSSFCGVTGLKPSWGRVSLQGAMPMNPWLDTAGPIARSAAECAVVFRVLATRPGFPAVPLSRLRIGLPATFFDLVHPQTLTAVEAAARHFETLGATLVSINAPDGPILDEGWQGFVHTWAEAAGAHPHLVDDPGVNPEVAVLLQAGRDMPATAYAASRARAYEVRQRFIRVFETVHVLLTPTTAYPAPPVAAERVEVAGGAVDVHEGGPSRLTVPINLAGLPALAFPVGHSSTGLPIGAQLIGSYDSEETLLAAVEAYQLATEHHQRTPPGHRATRATESPPSDRAALQRPPHEFLRSNESIAESSGRGRMNPEQDR
jgi:aspartyl-tRNA(Asn)/glutamyl-tRNA(Gln) amidotransferase subunit A